MEEKGFSRGDGEKRSIISEDEALRCARQAEKLLGSRDELLRLWQDIAENFYVEAANFYDDVEYERSINRIFNEGLTTSRPHLANRDLADMLSMSLRPNGKRWFNARVSGVSDEDAGFLKEKEGRLYELMYHRLSGFSLSTALCDRSHAAFGNAVISCEPNYEYGTLLYKYWNIRDVAWVENYDGTIGAVFRKWQPTYLEVCSIFKDAVHPYIKEKIKNDPDGARRKRLRVYHCFMESEKYMGRTDPGQKKYVSLFYDYDHRVILRAVESDRRFYSVSRWARSGLSQYGFSPATITSLPDARLLQQQEMTLLEAGQKAVDPTTIEKQGAIRGDVNFYSGGSIIIDREYDEKFGEAIRTLDINGRNIPFGLEMMRRVVDIIEEAHYRDLMALPLQIGGMSPLEVSQRTAEYLRKVSPILSPLESEYSSDLCDLSWNVAAHSGFLFGPDEDIPESLQGADVTFDFVNPMKETEDRTFVNNLSQALGLVGQIGEIEPSANFMVKYPKAVYRSLSGLLGEDYLNSVEQAQEKRGELEEARAEQEMMQRVQDISSVVKDGSEAAIAASEAGSALQGMI